MHWIVGSGQRVHFGPGLAHAERGNRTVIVIHHGRSEVGRKILHPIDSVDHRIPAADGIELRITDAVHRRLSTHAVINRIGILKSIGTEELGRIYAGRSVV